MQKSRSRDGSSSELATHTVLKGKGRSESADHGEKTKSAERDELLLWNNREDWKSKEDTFLSRTIGQR